MISNRDALQIVTYLCAAGSVNPLPSQAEVWADVINTKAPHATFEEVWRATKMIATADKVRVNVGELLAALARVKSDDADAERRRLQLERSPEDKQAVPHERLREIFAQHGLNPKWRDQ